MVASVRGILNHNRRRFARTGDEREALAQALRVPSTRLHEIVKERRAVTPDTALRLARYFGGDALSWLNLQASYDLKVAERELGPAIESEVKPRAA
jgi:addiction module HigA family antidote